MEAPGFTSRSIFIVLALILAGMAGSSGILRGQILYEFGDPTPDEQLYLELINRARANPSAEGARLAITTDIDVLALYSRYGVNLTMMQSEFNALPTVPPLAPNAKLTSTARSHSAWMLENATQSHDETSPANTSSSRILTAGYDYSISAENIYAYCKSVWFGHAGFQVDWGPGGTGGMMPGRGHRANIHNANYREIGVGLVVGTNGSVGPQLITQDLATEHSSPSFGTGVAYYDMNSNNFYDVGEGVSGLTVHVSGADCYCTTAQGGGWAVPIPSTAATRTVSFTGLNINQDVSLVVPDSLNAKADLKLSYSPPTITSSASAFSGVPHTINFTNVGGATSYRWDRWSQTSAPAENCESTGGITTATSGSYSVRNTSIKYQGSSSFHLAIPDFKSQSLELNSLYYGEPSASISFQSRIRGAFTKEHFKVQVKEEGGDWIDVYDQAGMGSSGESSFSLRTAAMTAMEGKAFRVRFLQQYGGGDIWGTSNSFGWFIDAINFSNVSVLTNTALDTLSTNSGSFTAPTTGTCLISITPVISGRDFPAAYQTLVIGNPPTFASWSAEVETLNGLPVGTLANHPNGDLDHDGRSNLIEFAFGGSPVLANDNAPGMPVVQPCSTHLILEYRRDISLSGVTVTPQAAVSLGNWKAPGESGAPTEFTDTLISTEGVVETRKASIPIKSANRVFMRMQVTGE